MAGTKEAVNYVVGSKVKEFFSDKELRCSGDLVEAVSEHVQGMLKCAAERCKANGRATVRPEDL